MTFKRFLATGTVAFSCAALMTNVARGEDCNNNGINDTTEIAFLGVPDCNHNGRPDECDLADGTSIDIHGDGVPDECQEDCNLNGVPDETDIAAGTSSDCNRNGVPDECDIATGTSQDCAGDGVPDECERDCNLNGIADSCDILNGFSEDVNQNGNPDECEARRFRVIDPGTIADRQTFGFGINDFGDICGESAFSGTPGVVGGPGAIPYLFHGFLYDFDMNALTDMGAVEGVPLCSSLGCESAGIDINNFGEVCGQTTGPAGYTPILWMPAPRAGIPAGFNELPILEGSHSSIAEAMNDNLELAGQALDIGFRAVRWTWDGGAWNVEDLGTLRTANDLYSYAYGINAHGEIVGTAYADTNLWHAFLWLPAPAYGMSAGMHDLTPVIGAQAAATAINDNGEIAGLSESGGAFVWLPEAAHGLPAGFTFLPNQDVITPTGVNNALQVVGGGISIGLDGPYPGVWLWEPEFGWARLNDLLPSGSPWDLRGAGVTRINNAGQIVGDALKTDETDINGFVATRAFLLVDADCPGDIDYDGFVGLADLASMLASFGQCDTGAGFNHFADADHSGCVDLADLAALLSQFGEDCR
ncbi:MAG: hypothetical protein KDA32_05840 [Phycisphaerales bacterium]|nr:hypothetical protein [Phycisphaerales bacterium]